MERVNLMQSAEPRQLAGRWSQLRCRQLTALHYQSIGAVRASGRQYRRDGQHFVALALPGPLAHTLQIHLHRSHSFVRLQQCQPEPAKLR